MHVTHDVLPATPAAKSSPSVVLCTPWTPSTKPRGRPCCLGSTIYISISLALEVSAALWLTQNYKSVG
ncbi:hypothetical protein Btru_051769 [Bulinus truncatus]|nr:hypothetical protein Btru_051769 [Bulinus truncatus]